MYILALMAAHTALALYTAIYISIDQKPLRLYKTKYDFCIASLCHNGGKQAYRTPPAYNFEISQTMLWFREKMQIMGVFVSDMTAGNETICH